VREPLAEIVYDAKTLIMTTAMSSELGVLADAAARIARADRHTRDFTLNSLRELIAAYVACIPVYRTYVSPRGWTSEDEAIIDRTIAEAERRNPAMERSLFRFLREVLLPTPPDELSADRRPSMYELRLAFAMKLQQYTGPVQAKGVEDTTFYRYNVLVSMNEVGADPAEAVHSIAEVHAANAARQRDWPVEMTTLSTHDTKLGEDVRARIHALSELTDEWQEALGRVLRTTSHTRTLLAGGPAPDRDDECRFLQVLLGCWPPGVPFEAPASAELIARLKAYMLKAIREAKRHTSWISQNDSYEAATLSYVDQVLGGEIGPRVLGILRPLAAQLTTRGVCNSLTQTVLKLTSPGVPDTYQGSESWKFDLVDPDNRRPVPFDALAAHLRDIDAQRESGTFGPDAIAQWLDAWPDGRLKLHVASALLRARRDNPGLWLRGAYRPLDVDVAVNASAIAFARTAATGEWALVIAGLRTARLPGPWPVGQAWALSRLLLPTDSPDSSWRDLFTGNVVKATRTASDRWMFLAQALQAAPVAVLVPASDRS